MSYDPSVRIRKQDRPEKIATFQFPYHGIQAYTNRKAEHRLNTRLPIYLVLKEALRKSTMPPLAVVREKK